MNIQEFAIFKSSKVVRSIHDTSYDKEHDEYMTECRKTVCCFDLVKRGYLNKLSLSEDYAKSVDALFQIKQGEDDGIYMVEFKNGDFKSNEIWQKAKDSLLIFCSITNSQIEYTRDNLHLVLVYNEKEKQLDYRDKKALAMANKSRGDFTLFGLGKLRGYCFRTVKAYKKEEFEKNIIPLI